MSEDQEALIKLQVAFLESDIKRLRREAAERDRVIQELYDRLSRAEETLRKLPQSFRDDEDAPDDNPGLFSLDETG